MKRIIINNEMEMKYLEAETNFTSREIKVQRIEN